MAEVVVNARAAARARLGGVERWAVEMACRLPGVRPGAYVVARPPRGMAYGAGQAWEQMVLPARALRAGARVVFSPANLAPLAWPGNVVVIHDAVALSHPEWYSGAYVAWQRAVLPAVARRARLVVTVSSFAREEVVARCGVAPDRVAVVAGGVDGRFSVGADAAGACSALGLSAPYVLAVAGSIARKNLGVLGAAVRALRACGIEVVVAGSRRGHHGAGAPVEGARDVGYVPDALLPGLYAGARAFVLPSLHEGFGLPCVEAMASGTPVVAAAAGALPETCGDAAVLVDPRDGDAVADALVAVVSDAGLAERLRDAGLARAAGLSWDRAAREIDALLTGVALTL